MVAQICPIWGTPASVTPLTNIDGYLVDSPRAGGKYEISDLTRIKFNNDFATNQNLCVYITNEIFKKNKAQQTYRIEEALLNKIIDENLKVSVNKPILTLKYLIAKSEQYGSIINITNPTNLPLFAAEICASNSSFEKGLLLEVKNIFDYLFKKGLINFHGENTKSVQYFFSFINTLEAGERVDILLAKHWEVTPEGYLYIESLELTNTESNQGFVAMWFNDEVKPVYEQAIKLGVEAAGYTCVRIDEKKHNDKIDNQIIAEIRKSRFLIADVTSGIHEETRTNGELTRTAIARGGVYYEAGFAHGLVIPVIWTCRRDMMDKKLIHFDTQQYNHIVWDDNNFEKLKNDIQYQIEATIGRGKNKS